MSAQIAHGQSFPAACRRCGGLLYESVNSCPYCDAHRPFDMFALDKNPKAALGALGPTSATRAAQKLSPAGAPAFARPLVKPAYFDRPLKRESQFSPIWRRIFTKGFLFVWFILALAYAAHLLLGANHHQEGGSDEQSMRSLARSASPESPQQLNVMSSPTEAGSQFSMQKPHIRQQFKDIADSLRAARAGLTGNNLTEANAALNAALVLNAHSEDARAIQRDIAAREQRRDIALRSAVRCATDRVWSCVQQRAAEALAIDSSSVDAQSLMERAILATAWTPLSLPNSSNNAVQAAATAPLPRGGANTVQLPSSRDWGTTGHTGLAASATTTPSPLPGATNATKTPANANRMRLRSADASTTSATANTSDTAGAANPASNDTGVDAEERSIVQFGWKGATTTDAVH